MPTNAPVTPSYRASQHLPPVKAQPESVSPPPNARPTAPSTSSRSSTQHPMPQVLPDRPGFGAAKIAPNENTTRPAVTVRLPATQLPSRSVAANPLPQQPQSRGPSTRPSSTSSRPLASSSSTTVPLSTNPTNSPSPSKDTGKSFTGKANAGERVYAAHGNRVGTNEILHSHSYPVVRFDQQ